MYTKAEHKKAIDALSRRIATISRRVAKAKKPKSRDLQLLSALIDRRFELMNE